MGGRNSLSLVLVLILVLIPVLVPVLILILVLVFVLVLILILIHGFPPKLSLLRQCRLYSLTRILGFILRFKEETCNEPCDDRRCNSTG